MLAGVWGATQWSFPSCPHGGLTPTLAAVVPPVVPSVVVTRLAVLERSIGQMRRAGARLESSTAAGTLEPFWAERLESVRAGLATRLGALERKRQLIAGEWRSHSVGVSESSL